MHNYLNVLVDGVCASGGPQHSIDLHKARHKALAQVHATAHLIAKAVMCQPGFSWSMCRQD